MYIAGGFGDVMCQLVIETDVPFNYGRALTFGGLGMWNGTGPIFVPPVR